MASLPARPRKRAPTHPGEVIAGVLEDAHISVRRSAEAIGMSLNGWAKVLRGETPITPDTALRIGAYFRNGRNRRDAALFWLRMQAEFDTWHRDEQLAADLDKIKPLPKEAVEGLPED